MRRFLQRIAAATVGVTALVGVTVALPAAVTGAPGAPSGVAWAAPLRIGDPAPAFAVKAFVKGTPVDALPKGKISVVEFWATWCGPCRATIPRLTEMAKKYPDVTFVGVSVFERDPSQVAPFVQGMGDKMDYRVALDKISDGGDGMDGVMAKTWMAAADRDEIPTTFIVDKSGKIAWIGSPMEMAEPLARITAGRWDLDAARAAMIQQQQEQRTADEIAEKIDRAMQTQDPDKILAAVDDTIQSRPKLEVMLGPLKLQQILAKDDTATALTYGKHLVDHVDKGQPRALSAISWSIVDPESKTKPTPELAALALKAAKRADDGASRKDGEIADTLAAALAANGDKPGAIEAETRAIALLKAGPQDPQIANEAAGMQKQLNKYKAPDAADK